MHHKRRRPKNRRAGKLGTKPWKMNGVARPNGENFGETRLKVSESRRIVTGPDDDGSHERGYAHYDGKFEI